MKPTNRTKRAVKNNSPRNNRSGGLDLELLAEMSASQVEHRTVLEFLRAVPH